MSARALCSRHLMPAHSNDFADILQPTCGAYTLVLELYVHNLRRLKKDL
jgi:hypothetical protein